VRQTRLPPNTARFNSNLTPLTYWGVPQFVCQGAGCGAEGQAQVMSVASDAAHAARSQARLWASAYHSAHASLNLRGRRFGR
jgi:hypothetical protein